MDTNTTAGTVSKVTLSNGATRSVTLELGAGTTYASVLADPAVRATLGLPENTTLINAKTGAEVPPSTEAKDGDAIACRPAAGKKESAQ